MDLVSNKPRSRASAPSGKPLDKRNRSASQLEQMQSDVNKNVDWLSSKWFWLSYMLLLGLLRGLIYLITPPDSEEWGWTALNIAHAGVRLITAALLCVYPAPPVLLLAASGPAGRGARHAPLPHPFYTALTFFFSFSLNAPRPFALPTGVLLRAPLEARLASVGGSGGAH